MDHFNFSSFLEKNPILDIFYRFTLWSLVAFGLYTVAAASVPGHGGEYIAKAIRTGNKALYWNVIASLGLIFWTVGLFNKNMSAKFQGVSGARGKFVASLSVVNKVSTDILSSAFNMSAGLLGWLAFELINKSDSLTWLIGIKLFFGIGGLLVLQAGLGFCLWVLKAKNDSPFIQCLAKLPWLAVLVGYPAVALLMSLMLWYQPV